MTPILLKMPRRLALEVSEGRGVSRSRNVQAALIPATATLLVFSGACVQEDAADEAIFTPEVVGTAAAILMA